MLALHFHYQSSTLTTKTIWNSKDIALNPLSSSARVILYLHVSNEGLGLQWNSVQFSSVAQSCPTLSDPMNHSMPRPPCPSSTPRVYTNTCPLSRWCHPAISSSVVPFFSCPQSLPASGSFPVSQLFTSGGQSIGVSASASVLPRNIKDWFPLGLTGLISLQPKGLSRVFSNTTVQKPQFFGAQLSLQSNSHIHTWPPEKP